MMAFLNGFLHHGQPPRYPESVAVLGVNVPSPVEGAVLVRGASAVYLARGPQEQTSGRSYRLPLKGGIIPMVIYTPWPTELPVVDPILALRSRIAALITRGTDTRSESLRGWLQAAIIGDKSGLTSELKSSFRHTGLYHLLVVSGLHVTMLAHFSYWILAGPFLLLYAGRRIGPGVWRRAEPYLAAAGMAGPVVMLFFSGFSAPVQRACVMYVLTVPATRCLGRYPLHRRLAIGAMIQSVIFPVGFLSTSNLMSWSAYLLVLASAVAGGSAVSRFLRLQLRLLLVNYSLIGNAPLVSVVTNGLLVPAFGVLYLGGLVLVAPLPDAVRHAVLGTHEAFLWLVSKISGYSQRSQSEWFGWLHPDQAVRWLLLVVAVVTLLSACAGMTMSTVAGNSARRRRDGRKTLGR